MLALKKYPILQYAFDYSLDLREQMEGCLLRLAEVAPYVLTVAVSGSLGRLEGLPHSDCDLLVLLHDDVSDGECQQAMQVVWNLLQPLDLRLPKDGGIYVSPTKRGAICDDKSLGRIADDTAVFGKRMQLLLDSQAVYAEDCFQTLLEDLLQRYATGFLEYDAKKEWLYLLNDVLRYFRAYCAWRQFDLMHDANNNWFVRNIKLRNSRLLMFAGLVLLLGECSKEQVDKVAWLQRYVTLTPLQRIEYVYTANADENFGVLLEAYEFFMASMHEPTVREALLQPRVSSLTELEGKQPPVYRLLHDRSKVIRQELTRFVLGRRNDWSGAFFEFLLF